MVTILEIEPNDYERIKDNFGLYECNFIKKEKKVMIHDNRHNHIYDIYEKIEKNDIIIMSNNKIGNNLNEHCSEVYDFIIYYVKKSILSNNLDLLRNVLEKKSIHINLNDNIQYQIFSYIYGNYNLNDFSKELIREIISLVIEKQNKKFINYIFILFNCYLDKIYSLKDYIIEFKNTFYNNGNYSKKEYYNYDNNNISNLLFNSIIYDGNIKNIIKYNIKNYIIENEKFQLSIIGYLIEDFNNFEDIIKYIKNKKFIIEIFLFISYLGLIDYYEYLLDKFEYLYNYINDSIIYNLKNSHICNFILLDFIEKKYIKSNKIDINSIYEYIKNNLNYIINTKNKCNKFNICYNYINNHLEKINNYSIKHKIIIDDDYGFSYRPKEIHPNAKLIHNFINYSEENGKKIHLTFIYKYFENNKNKEDFDYFLKNNEDNLFYEYENYDEIINDIIDDYNITNEEAKNIYKKKRIYKSYNINIIR